MKPWTIGTSRVALVAAVAFLVCASGGVQAQQPKVNEDAATIADFMTRVQAYVVLHKKVDDMLQEPSRDGRPEAVVEHQRAFARLMQKERPFARPGDIMTKPMRNIVRRLLASVLRGPDGRDVKRSILDENPGNLVLRVNDPYPENMPFSSVPLPVLEGLPVLPEPLAYRFAGSRMILLDPHGRLIVDMVEKVFP
jgi:hypothetical protein